MRIFHKVIIALSFAGVLGSSMYEMREREILKERLQTVRQQERQLIAELALLENAKKSTLEQLARISPDEQLRKSAAEIHRLRAELTDLRSRSVHDETDGTEARLKTLFARIEAMKNLPQRFPQYTIPELKFLRDDDWMELAKSPLFEETDQEVRARRVFSYLRRHAKANFGLKLHNALKDYWHNHNGLFPKDVMELKPYFVDPVDGSLLRRYEILHTGSVQSIPTPDTVVLAEIAPVDPQFDTRLLLINTNQIRVDRIQ